jgi:hypothetical protein
MNRGVAVAAVALLATLVAPAGLVGCAAHEESDSSRSAGPNAARQPAPTPSRDRTAAAPIASAPSADAADGADLFPPIDVEVRFADGTSPSRRNGHAYARRSGSVGTDQPLVRAELAGDGRCTLRMPGEGVYDVGVILDDGFVSTIERGVDTRTSRRVALTLPVLEEVRIELDPSDAIHRSGEIVLQTAEGSGILVNGLVTHSFWVQDLPASYRVSPHLRLRAEPTEQDLRCTPETFAGGATVVVGRETRGVYRLTASVAPSEREARHQVILNAQFETICAGATQPIGSPSWTLRPGERLAGKVLWGATRIAPSPHFTIRWHGDGFLPGSADVDAPDGARVDANVVLVPDDSRSLPGESEAVVRILGAQPGDVPRLWIFGADGNATEFEGDAVAQDAIVAVPAPSLIPAPLFAVAWANDSVSEFVLFESERRHELVLRPTGELRILVGADLPPDVWLRIRRRDGRPVPWHGEAGCTAVAPTVGLGACFGRIGPLPEGDVRLVVSYADLDLAEFSAHVVAGETTEVRVPLSGRSPR